MDATKPTDGVNATGSTGTSFRITEHPIEKSEKTFVQRQEQVELALLRRSQGIHLPLRLQAEKKCLRKVGHLPFLFRHEASLNSLTGRDELIGFDDFLGHRDDPEFMMNPHVILEKGFGLSK